MALMTTSGSMPFSLASASIVCCSGFDMSYAFSRQPRLPLELHFQVRPCDHADRHAVRPSIIPVDEHVGSLDAAEPTLEKPLAVHTLAHDDLRAAAGEAAVVVELPQRTIEPR